MPTTISEMFTYYDNIGKVFSGQGDPHQALEYHNESLAINLPTLGEDHPSVGSTYNSIANIYSDLGFLEKALEYHAKSLDIKMHTFGDNCINLLQRGNGLLRQG